MVSLPSPSSPSSSPIRTERSALHLFDLPAEWIDRMPSLTEEVDGLLDVHPEVILYGKVCHQQRSVSFFSDVSVGYRYSGQLARAKPLTESLQELLQFVNRFFQAEFNGILINKYADGSETIGKHSDDERALDRTAGVVSISVGASRKFRVRRKTDSAIVMDVPTESDKMMQMAGAFQQEFTHEIPVEKRVLQPRYSFTFRAHID